MISTTSSSAICWHWEHTGDGYLATFLSTPDALDTILSSRRSLRCLLRKPCHNTMMFGESKFIKHRLELDQAVTDIYSPKSVKVLASP